MENSLKYNLITTDDTDISYIHKDYTSKDFSDLLLMSELNDTNFIDYIQLIDDSLIEGMSYSLYGTANYWDLLLAINGRSPLFDMCYSIDTLMSKCAEFVEEYNVEYTGSPLPQYHIDYLNEIVLKRETARNEELRLFKVIKPQMMQEFLRLAREKGYV